MIAKKIYKLPKNSELNYIGEECDNEGCFFIQSGNSFALHGCREELRYAWDMDNLFIGFYCPNIDIVAINDFFSVVENKLRIPKKQQTVFQETTKDHAIVCNISPFWKQNIIYKDFFSLLLRCAAVYYKGDFNKALKSYKLTSVCLPAIKILLDAKYRVNTDLSPIYTLVLDKYNIRDCQDSFSDDFLGFVDTFKNIKPAKLKEMFKVTN